MDRNFSISNDKDIDKLLSKNTQNYEKFLYKKTKNYEKLYLNCMIPYEEKKHTENQIQDSLLDTQKSEHKFKRLKLIRNLETI